MSKDGAVHFTPSRRDRWVPVGGYEIMIRSGDDFGVIHWRQRVQGFGGSFRFDRDRLLQNLGKWIMTDGPVDVKAESSDDAGVLWIKPI